MYYTRSSNRSYSCLNCLFSAYFYHLTDIHYDPWYNDPIGISCNEPIANGGAYGDFECDSPWKLVVDSVRALKNLGTTDVKFLLWSG